MSFMGIENTFLACGFLFLSSTLRLSENLENENSQDLIWEASLWVMILENRQGLARFPSLRISL